MTAAPVLPAFHGKPIDTPAGHRWAGYVAEPAPGTVDCDECGERHVAEYSHEGQWGQGAVFAVVCGEFTDYYQEGRVSR